MTAPSDRNIPTTSSASHLSHTTLATLKHGELIGDGHGLHGQRITLLSPRSVGLGLADRTEQPATLTPLKLHCVYEVVRQTGPTSYLAVRIASNARSFHGIASTAKQTQSTHSHPSAITAPPWRLCGSQYTIHCWSKVDIPERQLRRITRRAQAWQAFPHHPNVARLHHIFQTDDLLFLVVENMRKAQQSLREFLEEYKHSKNFTTIISEVFMQMSVAFAACDTIPLECELKLDHFVVIKDNLEDPRHFIVKLALLDVRQEWESGKLSRFAPDQSARENRCQNPKERSSPAHRCDSLREERTGWYEGCLYSRLLHPAFEGALGVLLLQMLLPVIAPHSTVDPTVDRPFRVAHACQPELSCFRGFLFDVLSSVVSFLEDELEQSSSTTTVFFVRTMQTFGRTVYDLEEAIEAGVPLSMVDSPASSPQVSPIGSELRHFRWAAQEMALNPRSDRCLRFRADVYCLTTDCSPHIIALVDEEEAHLLADFLLYNMPGILSSKGTGSAVRNTRKLVRKLYDKAGSLPQVVTLKNVKPTSFEPVGGGGFSDVFKGHAGEEDESEPDPATPTPARASVALKRIRLHVTGKDKITVTRRFRREVLVMYMITILKPPNIVPFLGLESDLWPNHLPCIVTPWIENGTVLDYLRSRIDSATDELFRKLFEGISNGMLFLHDQDVIHGDLCGRNILVDDHGVPQLADFGLSWFIDVTRRTNTNEAGSVRWMAPELIDPSIKFERTRASDIYALGCTFLEISTGQPPFAELENEAAVMRQILDGYRPSRTFKSSRPFWKEVKKWQWDLIKACWRTRPENRLDAKAVVATLQSLVDLI